MSLSLQEKYDAIIGYEEQFAYRLAKEVVRKPEISVWMILLPVLFVHHMMKINQYKTGIHTFARNILGTKRKALDKAYEEIQTGKPQGGGINNYFPEVPLLSDEEKLLAEKQIRVIKVMEQHYHAMLETQGATLEELFRNVYRSSGDYRYYLNRLAEEEREFNHFLKENYHSNPESRQVIESIEQYSEILRGEEVRFFFQDTSGETGK